MATSRISKIEHDVAVRNMTITAPTAGAATQKARQRRSVAPKDQDNVAHALLRTTSAFKRLTTQRMKEEFDITGIQAEILMLLTAEPGMLGNDLAAVVGVNASTVSHALDVMEKQHLLTRRRCTQDRRVVCLALTEKARRIATRSMDVTHHILDALTAGISQTDLRALRSSLERMARNCQQQALLPYRNGDLRTMRKS